MSIAKFSLVALDCPDPTLLAAFYQHIVGGDIKPGSASGDWVTLVTGTGTDIAFQRDDGYRAPEWPDGLPQQIHIDFDVDDLDVGEQQVLEIGARKTDIQPEPDSWRVFLDPAGHPFCLVKA